MPLTIGDRLGHYDVTALIGEGGMGQVYQATDTKLHRDVALKVLPQAFTDDPERLARFEREATVLASLNHTNIGHIYGLEEAEGQKALVLELVEGPTLTERIKQGPIPVDEALAIAKQIAEALEAAHEQGIIHRDLKPANIKIKEDGMVKVLDFGLAKAFQPDASDPNMSQSPTISLTAAATQMGMVIGTAAYMAPEQAKGKVVDKRADVWAFGAVLYEMLTGQKPFTGKDVSDTLAAVLRIDADFDALPDETPPRLRQVLKACLQKEPKDRVRDIGDVTLAMDGTFDTPVPETSASETPRPQVWQRPVPLVLAVVALVGIAGVAGWGLKPQTLSRPLARFAITQPTPDWLTISIGNPDLTISQDGTHIVNRAGGEGGLMIRPLAQLEATRLPELGMVFAPFMSPDGASIGFRSLRGNSLERVSVLGGPSVTICPLPIGFYGFGASWGADDTIIFGATQPGRLMRVSAGGGEPDEVTVPNAELGEVSHEWPDILPGGRAVLFTIISTGPIENAQIAVVDLETGVRKALVPGGSYPRYAPTGHIVYGVSGTLRAVGFDLDSLEVTTNALHVLDGVMTKNTGAANFSFSRDGTLVYAPGTADGGGAQRTLVWVDREGREEPFDLPPGGYAWPRISSDGSRVAIGMTGLEGADVWTSNVARGTLSILTTDPAGDVRALWTPDGDRVVFSSEREPQGLFWKAADGSGPAEPLLASEDPPPFDGLTPLDWSADGTELIIHYSGPDGDLDIGVVSMEAERSWQPLLSSGAVEANRALSPDSRWIAYQSNVTGQHEVYVERFPDLGDREQISTSGGQVPVWSLDGSELFYRDLSSSRMMVVPIDTEPTLTLGDATVVFEGTYLDLIGRQYDLASDGRFLMIKVRSGTAEDSASALPPIVVVEGWFEELKRLVPLD